MARVQIHLGFEVGSGKPVSVPLKHLCVTGQTQESGKTTCLEALISRAELPAIAFSTKRGERSFQSGRRIPPFFEERANWEFIESILEAIMRQRMKFERAWLVRACKGATTLAGVQKNVQGLMAKSKRSMDQDIYMLLNEYLQKVIPLLAALPKSSKLELSPGLNVMDLRDYPEELQFLVISSTVRSIHQHEQGCITIIPEAWKFVPQGRNTPVKCEVEKLARQGAALGNYVWLDSQDLAGVEKTILRAAAVWLLGVQREANEVERALDNIPRMIRRPTSSDIAKLKIGEFYACFGEHVHEVYVQPAWVTDQDARRVAMGQLSAITFSKDEEGGDEEMDFKQLYEQEKQRADSLQRQLDNIIEGINDDTGDVKPIRSVNLENLIEVIYQRTKDRLLQEQPHILDLVNNKPEINVQVKRSTITMNTETLDGRLAVLIANGFFDSPKGNKDTLIELERLGWKSAAPRVSESFGRLAKMGFLYRQDNCFQAVAGMKVNVVEEAQRGT